MNREEALKYAKFRLECYSKGDEEYTEHGEFLVAAIKALQEPERKKGHWEIVVGSNGKEYMVCTECRKQQNLTGVFSYCPNCGSDMGGEENET